MLLGVTTALLVFWRVCVRFAMTAHDNIALGLVLKLVFGPTGRLTDAHPSAGGGSEENDYDHRALGRTHR